ncbi:hypothetical protein SETIT_1G128100v2 [Setaria italica]|uniref:Uncharacterized protein n=1 Tax=Setaria italica TaxID=4555 RepID=A0A368PK23_SETIT|nr:hypothetical protein SETIT_1G128100v2 [Setaria italica]
MKKLQALANAEYQESFIQDVRMMLHGWENFFSSYFTEEIKQMVTKLNCLIKEIDDEPSQQLISMELSGRMKQVDEMLEEALLVCETITRSVLEIEPMWLDVGQKPGIHQSPQSCTCQQCSKTRERDSRIAEKARR